MKKIYFFMVFLLLQIALVAQDFTLRIIHNNDGESKLLPIEVDGRAIGGAAPFKTAVDSLRAESTPSILLSSGDNFLAGVVFEANVEGQPLYGAQVLDALSYDAICIGNHDFDFGPDVLAQMIGDISTTTPPYLSANLDFTGEANLQALVDAGRIAPKTVLDIEGQRIGVIGLTTSNLASISNSGNVVINTDILGVAQAEIAALKADGVNKIILISHLQGIQEEIALAGQLTDVDVIIAGGGDELLTNDSTITLPGVNVFGSYPFEVTDATGATTYIVTTPGEYRYVGNLVLEFDGEGKVTNIADESNPILVADIAPDAELQANVIDSVLAAISNVQVLARTEVDLDGTRASIRSVETNQGNLIADAFLHTVENATDLTLNNTIPVVALTNGGGIRNNDIIRANSEITDAKTKAMLPFGNGVVVLNPTTPAQVKTVLENAVAAIGSGEGTGRFGQIGGFSFIYNPAETPSTFSEDGTMLVQEGSRIISATLDDGTVLIANGLPVADAPSVYFVTNDFIAGGRDGYTTFGELGILAEVSEDYQLPLNDYLVNGLNGVVTADQYPVGGEGRILVSSDLTVRFIHNNDGESKLLPVEIDGRMIGGAAPFKTVVDNLRADGTPSLLLSSGDNFLAGVVFEANVEGQPLYDAQVLDALAYDAICIGNHDFDFGPDVLAQMISDFSMTMPPYLSANLIFDEEPSLAALEEAGRIAPFEVLNVNGQLIGVFALTTPNVASISNTGNVEVETDIQGIAKTVIDLFKEAGINKIVLISHLQGIEEDIELAGQLTDVDVIIAGGGDELLTNDASITLPGINIFGDYPLAVSDAAGETTYIVTTPGEYRYVGNLVVNFDAAGKVTSIADESNPILVEGVEPDADLQANVIDPIVEAISTIQTLAITEVDLDGTRSGVRSRETNQGNLVADAFLFVADKNKPAELDAAVPVVALTNGGGMRDDAIIRAGSAITDRKTKEILLFGNKVVILNQMTPAQLKTVCENAVAAIGNGTGTGRFGQIGGFEFVYDPNGTPSTFSEDGLMLVEEGNRIVSITLADGTPIVENGALVDGAPNVYMVTNDFIAGGRDGYTTFGEVGILAEVSEDYQFALNEYLLEGLNGVVTAAKYPVGGEGRITIGQITTSTDQLDVTEAITVFPNPNKTGVFAIETEALLGEAVLIKVNNLNGQLIGEWTIEHMTHQQQIIEIPATAGMYFIELLSATKRAVAKVVIE